MLSKLYYLFKFQTKLLAFGLIFLGFKAHAADCSDLLAKSSSIEMLRSVINSKNYNLIPERDLHLLNLPRGEVYKLGGHAEGNVYLIKTPDYVIKEFKEPDYFDNALILHELLGSLLSNNNTLKIIKPNKVRREQLFIELDYIKGITLEEFFLNADIPLNLKSQAYLSLEFELERLKPRLESHPEVYDYQELPNHNPAFEYGNKKLQIPILSVMIKDPKGVLRFITLHRNNILITISPENEIQFVIIDPS